MVEAGIGEFRDRGLVEADAGGDQVGVEAEARGMSDEFDEIAPRRRFAAGKMQLQNADGRGLREDLAPARGVELALTPIELERVRAIGAAQGAAMRELGEQPDGAGGRGCVHRSTSLFVASSVKSVRTSVSTRERSAVNVLARS